MAAGTCDSLFPKRRVLRSDEPIIAVKASGRQHKASRSSVESQYGKSRALSGVGCIEKQADKQRLAIIKGSGLQESLRWRILLPMIEKLSSRAFV